MAYVACKYAAETSPVESHPDMVFAVEVTTRSVPRAKSARAAVCVLLMRVHTTGPAMMAPTSARASPRRSGVHDRARRVTWFAGITNTAMTQTAARHRHAHMAIINDDDVLT
jgi:hypothetical protein